jgi:hypothetical protein
MQNIVLSVARARLKNGNYYDATNALGDPDVTKARSPRAVGIHFSKSLASSKTYLEFVDMLNPPATGQPNHLYEPLIDSDIAVQTLDRGVYISRIYVDGACTVKDFTTADIIFDSPDAAVTFVGDGGTITNSCSFLKIELTSPTLNLKKTITVRITGQISNQ